MKVKTFTESLRLATISFLGIITLSSEAEAASINFGSWTLNKAIVTPSSSFAAGKGSAAPHTLKALAAVSFTGNPASWGEEGVMTRVSLSNFFTVEAGEGEKAGDKVEGFLVGNLGGKLGGGGLDVLGGGTGSFYTLVQASADAGFQTFSFLDYHTSTVSGISASNKPVSIPFRKPGVLTIGERYPFNMDLMVLASKTGAYQSVSDFDSTFTADVEAVPEPLTIMASGVALGFGAFFKKEYSGKQKKAKSLEKQKV